MRTAVLAELLLLLKCRFRKMFGEKEILAIVRHIIFVSMFLAISLHAICQEYPMRHFTIEDGLPCTTYTVIQKAFCG